jgi:hypothetical protein
VLGLRRQFDVTQNEALFLFELDDRTEAEAQQLIRLLKKIEELRKKITAAEATVTTAETNISRTDEGRKFVESRASGLGQSFSEAFAEGIARLSKRSDRVAATLTGSTKEQFKEIFDEFLELGKGTPIPPRRRGEFTDAISPVEIDRERIVRQLKEQEAIAEAARTRELQQQQAANQIAQAESQKDFAARLVSGRDFFARQQLLRREDLANQQRILQERLESVQTLAKRQIALIALQAKQRATEALPTAERARVDRISILQKEKNLTTEQAAELQTLLSTRVTIASLTKLTNEEEKEAAKIQNTERSKTLQLLRQILGLKTRGRVEDEKALAVIKEQNRLNQETLEDRDVQLAAFGGETNAEAIKRITQRGDRLEAEFAARNTSRAQQDQFNEQQAQLNINQAIKTQIDVVTGAIDAAFATIIDGFVEGSFEFRELSQTLAKDFITAGFEGIINQIKSTVTKGLKTVFTALGKGADDAAAGAQRAAQGLLLGFGLLLAVLSRSGNEGDFQATGGGGGGGVDQSAVQTRGLIGGDTQIAIAEINNGLQEAMIPTNAILTQIERNTRAFAEVGVLGDVDLSQLISDRVDAAFAQSLLNP